MKNPSDTVEFNSLNWVKKELDLVLEDAQKAFNIYIDDASETDKLQECIDQIHLIHGTLLMVELYGAAMLAEEIEELVKSLRDEEVSGNEEIYQLIMGAMLRLPDYLDGLISGNKDVPIVLLPVLNDLRAARNESLLSESLLFFPDVDVDENDIENIVVDASANNELQALAKRLRPHFQLGLLTWFKDEKPLTGLKRIQAVINELEKNSVEKKVRRLWTVSSALLESLIHKGINSSITVKLLIGKIDRLNKELIDHGEAALEKSLPADIIKNILYYIARSDSLGDRVSNIKEIYKLNELLPGNNAENEAALNMGGPNIDLLQTVAQAIREDFTEVKDALEIFVHGEEQDRSKLESLPALLAKIADTMGMLSLGAPRQMILEQKNQVEKFVSGELDATDQQVMDVASVLLNAEAKLNNFISRKSDSSSDAADEADESHDSEYQEVLSTVAREALTDFNQAKHLILQYAESPGDSSDLERVVKLFADVSGAMFMEPLDILAPLIRGISSYIQTVLINAGQLIPEQLDVVADAVTSIEYYLESVIEGRKDLNADLNFGRSAVDKLRVFAAELGSSVDSATAEKAAQANEASIDLDETAVETAADDGFSLDMEDSEFELNDTEIDAEPAIDDTDFGLDLELELDSGFDLVEESSEVEPAPVAEKTTSVISKTKRPELAIIGDDTDEEIFEIFIEEALEVLAEINENLPQWKFDNSNEDARASVRRSFHTLKGSGRLIGAMMIGEFSWSIENMINKVIDKSIPLTAEVFFVLEEAVTVLPQLIEQMQGNKQPVANIYDLMEHADALSRGERFSPPVKAEVTATVASENLPVDDTGADEAIMDPAGADVTDHNVSSLDIEDGTDEIINLSEPEDELMNFDEDSFEVTDEIEFNSTELTDFDEGNLSDELELSDEFSLESELIVEDEDNEFSFEVSEDEISLESALEVDELAIDLDDDLSLTEVPVKLEIDPELFRIFRAESEGHLDTIRHILILNQTDNTPVIANDELIRALHTLFGSARTAEVPAISSICGIAEQYIRKKQENQSTEVDAAGIAALNELVASVTDVLNNLQQEKQLPVNQALVDTLSKLSQAEAEAGSAIELTEEADLSEAALVSYGDIDDELVDIFLEEAEELVEGAEHSLQQWRENLGDVESVNELKRILHTLKGGARMAELTPIGDLTHALESAIIETADSASPSMMGVMQEALDTIVNMLTKVSAREPIQSAAPAILKLKQARSSARSGAVETATVTQTAEPELLLAAEDIVEKTPDEHEESSSDLDIEFDTEFSSPDTEDDDADELEISILSPEENAMEVESEELENIAVEEAEQELVVTSDYEHSESTELTNSSGSNVFKLDPAARAKQKDESQAKAVQELVRVKAELLNDLVNNAGEVNIYNSRFNQQLSDFGYNLTEFDQTVVRLREQLRNLEIETENQILSRHEKESSHYDVDFDPLEMDRYSTLQQLSRSLSESVSDLASIKDFMSNTVRESETLLLQQSRISTELQQSLMSTRMIKFNGLSSRLARIVRQTSRELGKNVEFEIFGDELEVDRTILDRIVSPLEHLLRNAVAHGIETNETRASLNKTETGKVTIHVSKQAQDLVIDVADNGSGINVDAIRNSAIKKGMITVDSELSDHEIVQFILEPGFSTAKDVTQISGRGVGLDVVDSEIKQLSGTLDIQSKLNKGSHFIARLPMTLSISQALLVHLQDEIFAVPLNTIEGIVRLSGYELDMIYEKGLGYYEFGDDKYEVKYLGYLLKGRKPEYLEQAQPYPILLVKTGDLRIAVHVDSLVGRREIVVKPVGQQISTVKGVSGATILGDGHVVLILDMASLLRSKSVFQIESQAAEMLREAEKAVAETITVMVVDDSITIRKVTERILLRHGMEVILAKDGLDATAKLQERLPDIMLLDIEMPRMDGYEVASMVRNNEHMKDLPIIMITSRTGTKHKEKAMEIGVNRYLGKPYQEDELMENITTVLAEEKVS
ncbi:MAG: Hpt domain-containing protein [Gammaproteobacteria bacterium]|nr:Hpt domain-containing protein [Gammaproteobacteria bacterium]